MDLIYPKHKHPHGINDVTLNEERICSTCKWKYETEHYIGCNNPSPDRVKWAEHHHVYEPCGIWESIKIKEA